MTLVRRSLAPPLVVDVQAGSAMPSALPTTLPPRLGQAFQRPARVRKAISTMSGLPPIADIDGRFVNVR